MRINGSATCSTDCCCVRAARRDGPLVIRSLSMIADFLTAARQIQ